MRERERERERERGRDVCKGPSVRCSTFEPDSGLFSLLFFYVLLSYVFWSSETNSSTRRSWGRVGGTEPSDLAKSSGAGVGAPYGAASLLPSQWCVTSPPPRDGGTVLVCRGAGGDAWSGARVCVLMCVCVCVCVCMCWKEVGVVVGCCSGRH